MNNAPPPPPVPGTASEQPTYHYDYSNSKRLRMSRSESSSHGDGPWWKSQSADASRPLGQQKLFPEMNHATQRSHPDSTSRKRPLQQFHCEPCDLYLESKSAYDAHRASHTSCTICGFCAAPKIVKGHYQSVHGKFSGSGFKTVTVSIPGCPVQSFRICVGNRPEDIQQWIAERKKKFPRMKRPSSDAATRTPENTQTKESAISSLLEGYGSSDSDLPNDKVTQTKSADEQTENLPVAASEDGPTKSVNPPSSETPPSPGKRGMCRAFARHGRCRRGSSCPYIHDPICHLVGDSDNRSSSLLRKLLQKEVEREAVLSVELLKYIVQSDFLRNRLEISPNAPS